MKTSLRLICIYITAAFVLLTGCTTKQADSTDKVFDQPVYSWGNVSGETITIWGDKDDLARPYLTKSFSDYERATGNTIETVILTKEEQDQKVPYIFQTDESIRPDILLSYGGTNLVNLEAEHNFYDFTDAIWVNDLTDTAINQTIFNGKVMGLPFGECSISGTLYNKEIFETYNINIPKTQEEFLNVCKVLLEKGITPVYLPYAEVTMLLYQFPLDSIVKDKNILDGINNNTLSYSQIPEMKTMVEWYKTMSDSGYFGTDYQSNDWTGMDEAMKSGKYAMMLCWDTWLYTNFSGDASNFGLMPAFIGIPPEGCFEGPNISLLIVNKNSPRLNAALDLVTFMADPYNYNLAFKDIYTAPLFNNQLGSISTPQYMESERLIDKKFNNSTAWLRIEGFSQIDAKYIQEYMEGSSTLEECLNKMDTARVNRAINKQIE